MSGVEKTSWDKMKEFFGSTVIRSISEIHALMPDSILFGSFLLYVLTQNMAFGVFAIFIFESIISHKLISWIAAQSVGPSQSRPIECRAGYKTPQYSVSRIFAHDPYPSYSVFAMTTIATYLGLSTKEFSDTMTQMGPEWQGRSMVAYIFIGLFLAAFIIMRLMTCDTLGEVVVATILAILSGVIFFIANKALFGIEGMNFLGLPYMVSKQSEGQPIYVCSKDL